MKKKKNILSGLLAALLLTSLLASCAGGTGDGKESVSESSSSTADSGAPSTDSETEEQLDLPADLRFDGQKIVFLCRNDAEWTSDDIYSEGGGEDTISDAVFKRNQLVEKRLGVKIEQMWANGDEVKTKVQQAVTTNLDDFHVAVSHAGNAASMATSGYLRDLNSDAMEYLDLTKDYWDQNLIHELSIENRVYFATGEIMTIDNDATFCLLFNKTLASDYKLPNLYKMVENKEWTLDKQLEFMDIVASDSSDADRIYGLVRTTDTPYAIYHGGGVRTVSKDSDTDNFVYALDVDRADKVATVSKKILDKELSIDITSMASQSEPVMVLGQKYFGGGKALFYSDVMQSVERMRAYELDFGVLPNPLYDSNQASYYHMMHYTGNVVSIPRSARIKGELLNAITATLEAMSFYSTDTLTKQYYDINLTSKYINDPESAPMIELILNTRVYDLAYYYNVTGDSGNITGQLASAMCPGGGGLGSLNRTYSKLMEKKISQFIYKMSVVAEKYGE